MGTVHASAGCPLSVHSAQAAWCEVTRWHAWVEGLERIISTSPDWPQAGATVRWESNPAGRGSVSERVLRFEPLVLIELEIEDDQLLGRQLVSFVPAEADQTEVGISLGYRIKRRSPLTPVLDFLFIRRAVETSLRSTLHRFAADAASAR
jgi:hypothetical protein